MYQAGLSKRFLRLWVGWGGWVVVTVMVIGKNVELEKILQFDIFVVKFEKGKNIELYILKGKNVELKF